MDPVATAVASRIVVAYSLWHNNIERIGDNVLVIVT